MAVVVPIISTFDSKGVTKAIADFKKLDGAGQKTQFALGSLNKGAGALGAQMAKFGAITAGVVGVVGGSLVKAAYESQKVMKQTEAIVAATGGAAGLTAKQIGDLSEQLSNQTGIDDELIQSSMNLLLTFKQVRNEVGAGNDIFNRASMAALDLGNVFGSTDAAAKMLGKALSNPVKGINALTRAGVNFSDQQKAQIKTLVDSGKSLEAQKIILAEVEAQVGGTAVASMTAFDRMRVAIGNAAEDLGNILIPYVEKFSQYVIDNVVPVISKFSDIVGSQGLGAGIKFLSGEFFKATANMGAFGNAVLAVIAAFTALRLVMLAATVAQVAFNVALFANPIGIVVAAVIAFGVAMVALAVKFKVVRDAFRELWNFVVSYMQFQINIALGVAEFFINKFIGMINLLIKAWNAIPFTNKIDELQKVNLALDITGAKIGGLGKTAQTSAAQFRQFESGTAQVAKSLSGDEGGTGSGGLGKAAETVAEKFKKFAESARQVTSDQKNLRGALKNTADAQKTLQTATDKVADAQAKLNRIAAGYGAGSAEASAAQDELTQAQRAARQAGFDLTKATFAVTDAEDALAAARKEGTPREITEAEIALEEARMALTEAQEAVTESTEAVTTAQQNLNEVISGAATTSTAYKDALLELRTAEDAQAEAIDRVREAKEREIETTRNLAKAEILLRKAKGKLSKKQRAAADRLLGELNAPVTVTVPTATGAVSTMPNFDGVDWSSILAGINVGGIATLAEGGVAMKPTFALIAEGGEPEAVIPLSKLGGMGGDTYNIVINSKIADATLPDLIVGELRKFNRRSGAINIQVA
jgi:hypothetical protein